jgi:hypothetical protein
MALNSKLGFPVSTRTFSLLEMVSREWGPEFRAPDHRVYRFTGRDYDSTDLGSTGIYQYPPTTLPSKLKYTGIP